MQHHQGILSIPFVNLFPLYLAILVELLHHQIPFPAPGILLVAYLQVVLVIGINPALSGSTGKSHGMLAVKGQESRCGKFHFRLYCCRSSQEQYQQG